MALFLLFLICLFFSCRVHGWKMDASCTQMGVENDIRNAMIGAFDMVDSAYNRLTATPRAADTDELIGYLFGKDGRNPSASEMFKTQSIFQNLNLYYRTELTGNQEPDWKNIVSTIAASQGSYRLTRSFPLRLFSAISIDSKRLRADSTCIGIEVRGDPSCMLCEHC